LLEFGFFFMFTWISLHFGALVLINRGLKKKNFRSRKVPFPGGFFLLMPLFFLPLISGEIKPQEEIYALLIFFWGGVFLGGIIDDLKGEERAKGLKGHWYLLKKGKISSGNLKIILFFFSSLPLVIFFREGWEILLALVAGLAVINVFNLFDLRPGRSFRLFLFLGVLNTIPSWIGIGAGGLKYEGGEKIMLGDSGSNLLGSIVAVEVIAGSNILPWLVFGLLLNFLGEITSFSRIIENNSVLKWIDELGWERGNLKEK